VVGRGAASVHSISSQRGGAGTSLVLSDSFGLFLRPTGKVEQDKNDKIAQELHQKEIEESGEGIECGCCFGIAPFEKCVQCDEGHLFWYVRRPSPSDALRRISSLVDFFR
jgi:hypothetical protein